MPGGPPCVHGVSSGSGNGADWRTVSSKSVKVIRSPGSGRLPGSGSFLRPIPESTRSVTVPSASSTAAITAFCALGPWTRCASRPRSACGRSVVRTVTSGRGFGERPDVS